jgi:predicted esterase
MTQPPVGFHHRFIPGSRAETVLLLHGTGADENDLLPLAAQLLPGAAVLSPRGKVSEQGANRFFRRLAVGVFDEVDLRHRTDELAAFVTEAAAEYRFDPLKVIALGYSNGANIAATLLLLKPYVLSGAVLFRPTLPLTPDSLPDLAQIRVLIAAARHDEYSSLESTGALADLLTRSGALVDLHWEPGGHGLTHGDYRAAIDWFKLHYPGK